MKKRIRVSYNLKPETIQLVKIIAKATNEDMSTIVEQALNFRLNWIKKELIKEGINIESSENWFDEFWKNNK